MASNIMQGERGPAAGMDDTVTKPVRVGALIEARNQVRARDAI